jgi:hypothetical protein
MLNAFHRSGVSRQCLLLLRKPFTIGINYEISNIDKSGLKKYGPTWPSPDELKVIELKKEPISPLTHQLRSMIKVQGPLSVHDFMSQVGV